MSEIFELPFQRSLSRHSLDDFEPCAIPARAGIAGRHIALEPFDAEQHAAELYRAGHRSEEARNSWEYLMFGPWRNEAEFSRDVSMMAMRSDWVTFALRPNDGAVEGMASYLNIVPGAGVLEIGGLWFSPRLKRTRAATEALYLMLVHAFDDLRYRRVEWKCNAANAPSRRAARRLGFRHEGIFYRHMAVKGRNRDTAWYAMLDEDWAETRAVIAAWLEDANFDADGGARSSLGAVMAARSSLP